MNYREELIKSPLKVIRGLKKKVDDKSLEYESLINLESRQISLRKEKREGTITYQEIEIQQNKINAGVLDVINAIEEDPIGPAINSGRNVVYKKNKYTRNIAIVISFGLLLISISVLCAFSDQQIYITLSPIILGVSLFIYLYQEIIVLFTNNYALIVRRRNYYKRKSENPDKKTVLSEGDSWFCYPFVKDVTDYLSNYYNVFSLAESSDEAQKILRDGDLFAFAEVEKPAIIILSAGGNEISAKFRNKILYPKYEDGPFFTDYLDTVLNEIVLFYYEQALRDLEGMGADIILHGYDYPRKYDKSILNFGGSLYYAIKKRGYPNPPLVIKELIDLFNDRLSSLADRYSYVHYLDLRNTLKSREEWINEFHPNNDGFLRISTKFRNKIEEILSNKANSHDQM
ncbi:MAG: hypothetical protein AAF655_19820 [Bacteroidota bacterium]